MTRSSVVAAAILLGVSCSAAWQARADDFVCRPAADRQPQADAALSKVITSSKTGSKSASSLQAAISQLHRDGVSDAAILDHAVAAYCTLVARDSSLTVMQKRESVRNFASQTASLVYDSSQDEYIVLSVPVKPALSDQIAAAAAKSNQTESAWINQAIQGRLAGR